MEHFGGFPRACPRFFGKLKRNNNREWFTAHKGEFEEVVLEPARQFVLAVGERLQDLAPGVHADPRVDRSIFRVHRDTRFAKDKSPYKTHLAILFWEGPRKKLECPGFYFHLEANSLLLGGGIYMFSKELLAGYRQAVGNGGRGPALASFLAAAEQSFPNAIEQPRYQRVPRGFPADHAHAELLKCKGITIGTQGPIPAALYTPACVDLVIEEFKKMVPLHRWLLELSESV